MKRREFITILGGAVAWPLTARAQEKIGRPYRIGILETQTAVMNQANMFAFRERLRELGYVEGENLVLHYRSADGRGERFSELVAELLRVPVNLIVTRGTPAAVAAKHATSDIPIVMAAIGEPLLVVNSLAKPGANITGLSSYTTDLEAKRVEVMHDLMPRAAILAGLYNMSNPSVPPQWNELQRATRTLGLRAQLYDIREPGDIKQAISTATTDGSDALVVGLDALTQASRKTIVELAATHRLPAIYVSKDFVEAGGLLSYGPSYPDLYRRAAVYVDKILNGTRPHDLPVEQPTKFELLINVKTAKALGLEIPPTLLARADEVIE